MRKIQRAISSDLCIRLTWNLTGRCGQQQRLRGWSRMVVNNSKMADGRHSENRYIAISQRKKITQFSWNFVNSSRFWTGWTLHDQKCKSCIGQTPSSTERISCLNWIWFYLYYNSIEKTLTNPKSWILWKISSNSPDIGFVFTFCKPNMTS